MCDTVHLVKRHKKAQNNDNPISLKVSSILSSQLPSCSNLHLTVVEDQMDYVHSLHLHLEYFVLPFAWLLWLTTDNTHFKTHNYCIKREPGKGINNCTTVMFIKWLHPAAGPLQ